MITWDTLNDLLKVMLYVAGIVMIIATPVIIILALIRSPLDHILKSWYESRYRVIDNAMRATERITLDDGTIIVKQFVKGSIDYKKVHTPHNTEAHADIYSELNQDAIGAARWIVMSYATRECKNPKHQHGPNGRQLLTQDECLDPMFAVFGSPREWQEARDWLAGQLLVVEQFNTGLPGTHADRPLSELIKILTTLPQRKK